MSIYKERENRFWHITTATHNSRYSQRMFENRVILGKSVWLSEKEELIVTETIARIVNEDNLNIYAYNICGDHMHILLVCEKENLPKIVQKIKSMSARACNIAMGRTIPATREYAPLSGSTPISTSLAKAEYTPSSESNPNSITTPRKHASLSKKEPSPSSIKKQNRGTTQTHLWTQKFGKKEITNKKYLYNTIKYIRNNRNKHNLPENKELVEVIKRMTLCDT